MQDADKATHLPHFGVEARRRGGRRRPPGLPFTILRPNNFFQNDYFFKDVMLGDDVYPQPFGDIGLSRVDVRDIAEAAAIASRRRRDGRDDQRRPVRSPDGHGRRPRRGAVSSDARSRTAGTTSTPGRSSRSRTCRRTLVFDFRLMYAFFQEKGLKATPEDSRADHHSLGHPPRRFDEFAAETARAWSA